MPWTMALLFSLAGMNVDSVVQLELNDGTRRTLHASSSHSYHVSNGAAIIRAWSPERDAVKSPV